MFKEYDDFQEVAANTDKRISNLETEISKNLTESRRLENLYKQMVLEDSTGMQTYNVSEFNDVRKQIEELVGENKIAQERLQALKENRREQLKNPMVEVNRGRHRETQEITEQLKELFKRGREYRAKLLLLAVEANGYYSHAVELKRTYEEAQRLLDVDPYAYLQRSNVSLKIPESISEIEYHLGDEKNKDKHFMPDYVEMQAAYELGALPGWVKHYAETGELLTNADLK